MLKTAAEFHPAHDEPAYTIGEAHGITGVSKRAIPSPGSNPPTPPTVIPACAGIRAPAFRHAGVSRGLDSGLRRNDGGADGRYMAARVNWLV